MTHLVHVLPGYFSIRYREVTSNVDTIDISLPGFEPLRRPNRVFPSLVFPDPFLLQT